MKKIFCVMIVLFLVFPFAAANLEVEKSDSSEVLIVGLDEPATFDVKVTNLGNSDYFEFYNLVGFSMFPKGTVYIGAGKTENVKIQVYPIGNIDERGLYSFQYYIKGQNSSEFSDRLTLNILELREAFVVGSGELDPEASSLEVYIENQEDFNFENLSVEFSSAFFDFSEEFSLAAYEKKTFDVSINNEDIKKLMAGYYTLNADVEAGDVGDKVTGGIRFVEKDLLTTTKESYGFVISTELIEKVNDGNTISTSETVIQKNVISRLFTSFSPEPTIVDREGFDVFYTWITEINPGESFEIRVRTNWLLPLMILFLVVAIVLLAKKYSSTNVVLRKRVNFVRAKGGEFALRVSITVHAKKYVERVHIVDRLPLMVKVHERFGSEVPSRINEKTRRIEWDYEKLEQGEVRVLSYIVYSKVGILGKFALPSATAIYEREGNIQEAVSNRAFFVSEQKSKDEED